METATVGRKKAKPGTPARKPVILVVRGAPEWGEWLAELAEHCRATASELADDALTAYAKAQGFPKKPPRR
jgi:hypothetical protein